MHINFPTPLIDRYTLNVTDIQMVVCRTTDKWTDVLSQSFTTMDQHLVEKFTISLQLERLILVIVVKLLYSWLLMLVILFCHCLISDAWLTMDFAKWKGSLTSILMVKKAQCLWDVAVKMNSSILSRLRYLYLTSKLFDVSCILPGFTGSTFVNINTALLYHKYCPIVS